jgi:hypothetical protein
VACYRNSHFGHADCFPNGITIGCEIFNLTFTTSNAIAAFLPKGGTPGALSATLVNPTTNAIGSDGVLAGQLLSAMLNAGFDLCDPTFAPCTQNLKDRCFNVTCAPGDTCCCNIFTVESLIMATNNQFGTCMNTNGCSFSQLNNCLSIFNENYDNCGNGGKLKKCPE